MTESIIRTRAKHHDMVLRKDGHGNYLLTDVNNCLVAPGPMTLEEVELWLNDLEDKEGVAP